QAHVQEEAPQDAEAYPRAASQAGQVSRTGPRVRIAAREATLAPRRLRCRRTSPQWEPTGPAGALCCFMPEAGGPALKETSEGGGRRGLAPGECAGEGGEEKPPHRPGCQHARCRRAGLGRPQRELRIVLTVLHRRPAL